MSVHVLLLGLFVLFGASTGHLQSPDIKRKKGGFRTLSLKRKTIDLPHSEDPSLVGKKPLRSTLFPGFVDERDEDFDDHFLHPSARYLQNGVPIFGEYRRLAYYYAMIYVGNPRQRFSVIADTGSSLMAVPCKGCAVCGPHMNPYYDIELSEHGKWVTCADGCPVNQGDHCRDSTNVCRYVQRYAEGSSIAGDIVEDIVFMGGEDDFDADPETGIASYAIPFKFGCGTHEDNLFVTQEADGIMGLGQGGTSFVRQMWESGKLTENVFSLCLTMDGGSFTIGEIDLSLHLAPVQWAKMSLTGFYQIHVSNMVMDNTDIPVANMRSPGGSAILDSGTTFTYVPSDTYNAVMEILQRFCKEDGNCSGKEKEIRGEKLCYEFSNPEAQLATFPYLDLQLEGVDGGDVLTLRIPPEHLFLNMAWSRGAYCFSVYPNGQRNAVIGANFLMGMDVVFHMGDENSGHGPRVGFAPSHCTFPEEEEEDDTPDPIPTSSSTPVPSPEEGGDVPEPSGSPATATAAPTSTVSPKTSATDTDDDNEDEEDSDTYGQVFKRPGLVPVLTGFAIVSALAVGYFVATCEINVGRLHLRLGPASGRYATVEGSEGSGQVVGEAYTDNAADTAHGRPRIPSDAAIISVIPEEVDLRHIDPEDDGLTPVSGQAGDEHALRATGKLAAREQQRQEVFQVEDEDEDEDDDGDSKSDVLDEVDVELGNVMHQFEEEEQTEHLTPSANSQDGADRGRRAPNTQRGRTGHSKRKNTQSKRN